MAWAYKIWFIFLCWIAGVIFFPFLDIPVEVAGLVGAFVQVKIAHKSWTGILLPMFI
jgi:hypothetical protein